MRAALLILGIILAFVLIGGMIFFLFENRLSPPNKSIIAAPTPGPSPTGPIPPQGRPSAPAASDTGAIPPEWSYGYDAALQYEFAYPQGWNFHPAASPSDESALYSFSTDNAVSNTAIPPGQLKIAILFYPSGEAGPLGFDAGDVRSSTPVTVGGYSAVRRVLGAPGAGSVATTITVTGDTFIVSAYPGNSPQISVYDEFLRHMKPELTTPISVVQPSLGQTVFSPLQVAGQAPSGWMSEGKIPLELRSEGGAVIARTEAATNEDWTSGNPLPFTATLDFSPPHGQNGVLVIRRDNPSGLPLNDYSFFLPIEFTAASP